MNMQNKEKVNINSGDNTVIIEPEDNWTKQWEQESLCSFCKNNCYDPNMIVDACSSFEEVEGKCC